MLDMYPVKGNRETEEAERFDSLSSAGFNVALLPSDLVHLDLQTDSLKQLNYVRRHTAEVSEGQADLRLRCESRLRSIFGFPYVVPVAQGRLAEGVLAAVKIRGGDIVLGSRLFPTTRLHQVYRGATVHDLQTEECEDLFTWNRFKGELSIERLSRLILELEAENIACIYLEPCTNSIGGHPISMANLRKIRSVALKSKIPVFIDACRLIDNCIKIQEFEREFSKASIREILTEYCSLADGLTMGASKDFETGIGGCIAVREGELFDQVSDCALLFGDGLDKASLSSFEASLRDFDSVVARLRRRSYLVEALHRSVAEHVPVLNPSGAHAVYIDLTDWVGKRSEWGHSTQERFLAELYLQSGVRGAVHSGFYGQEKAQGCFVRFSVPITGITTNSIHHAAHAIRQVYKERPTLVPLVRELRRCDGSQPPRFRQRFGRVDSKLSP